MLNNNDFFSPENLDERLELFWLIEAPGNQKNDLQDLEPSIHLVQDLRALYRTERNEEADSLQLVWERLEEQYFLSQAVLPSEPETPAYLININKTNPQLRKVRREQQRVPGRWTAILAATLFLVLTLGSLFTLAHITRQSMSVLGQHSFQDAQLSPASPVTPPPDYPYLAPGHEVSALPVSSSNFTALSWSPDERQVAFATENQARVWDIAAQTTITIANVADPAPSPALRTVAWSPDGTRIAAGTNPVEILGVPDYLVKTTLEVHVYWPVEGNDERAAITALAWSPDNSMLAVAALRSDNNGCVVEVWNLSQQKIITTIDCQTSINALSWSSDSHYLALADSHTVNVSDIFATTPTNYIFSQQVSATTDISWSPGSSMLAFVNNNSAQVWDISTGTMSSQYPNVDNGTLTWSPNGHYLATAHKNQVAIWDVVRNAMVYRYAGNRHTISSLAWSPRGTYLISGEGGSPGSNAALIWTA